jgi:hypothetical protein
MIFGNQSFLFVVLTLLVIWVSILSFFVFRMIAHYNRLTVGVSKNSLKEILESVLTNVGNTKSKITKTEEAMRVLDEQGGFHLQRMGIVRFNPFLDTGGNQSFTLALLDGNDNGIVMTSLYARAGNRWYVKEIKKGKGELALSKEEESAIEKARRGIMK